MEYLAFRPDYRKRTPILLPSNGIKRGSKREVRRFHWTEFRRGFQSFHLWRMIYDVLFYFILLFGDETERERKGGREYLYEIRECVSWRERIFVEIREKFAILRDKWWLRGGDNGREDGEK